MADDNWWSADTTADWELDTGEDVEGEEEGGEGAGDAVPGAAQHCLVLLDCAPNMFFDSSHNDRRGGNAANSSCCCAMDWALQACNQVVRQRVRTTVIWKTGKRDAFGVVLFNTRLRTRVVVDETTATNDNNKKAADEKKDDDSDDDGDEEEEDNDMYAGYGPQETNVHEWIPLAPPGVSTVKTIQGALPANGDTGSTRQRDLKADYGHEEGASNDDFSVPPLQLALTQASSIFRKCKSVKRAKKAGEPSDKQQVWIFTLNDNPTTQAAALQVLKNTAQDVQENDIEIIVWPLFGNRSQTPPPPPFRYDLFFDTINAKTPARRIEEDDEEEEDLMNVLVESMQQLLKKTRRIFCLPMILPKASQPAVAAAAAKTEEGEEEDPALKALANYHQLCWMDWYRLVQVSKRPALVKIHQQTGRALQRITQIVAEDEVLVETKAGTTNRTAAASASADTKPAVAAVSGDPLTGAARLRTFCKFGVDDVPMTNRDKMRIKRANNINPDFASLVLIGFQPAASINIICNMMETAYFCYPTTLTDTDEANKLAFCQLHASMRRKQVCAMGEVLTRVSASSRLCAMFPLEQQDDDHPPGMLVVMLPFEDEIRQLHEDLAVRRQRGEPQQLKDDDSDAEQKPPPPLVTADLLQAAINLIQKQSFHADTRIGVDFDNANLTRFWNYVESVALQEETKQEDEFDTVVDADEVLQVAATEIQALADALPPEEEPGTKRKRAPATKAAAKKKPKKELPEDDSGVDWHELYANNELDSCKVKELQSYLKSVGEASGGKKAVLVERVRNHVEQVLIKRNKKKAAVKEEDEVGDDLMMD